MESKILKTRIRTSLILISFLVILALLNSDNDFSKPTNFRRQTSTAETNTYDGQVGDEDGINRGTESKTKVPIMHTFLELDPKGFNKGHERMIESWKASWENRGWETRVLTLDDAKAHPEFEKFTAKLERLELNVYEKKCYWRWMAMSSLHGDGYNEEDSYFMSDYDTIPLELDVQRGLALIEESNGMFTAYDNHVPCLMQGTRSEWDRVLHLLFDSLPKSWTKVSDMLSFLKVRETLGDDAGIIWKSDVQSDFPFQNDKNGEVVISCEKSKKLAVHLSHRACSDAYRNHIYPTKVMDHGILGSRGNVATYIGQEYIEKCEKEDVGSLEAEEKRMENIPLVELSLKQL